MMLWYVKVLQPQGQQIWLFLFQRPLLVWQLVSSCLFFYAEYCNQIVSLTSRLDVVEYISKLNHILIIKTMKEIAAPCCFSVITAKKLLHVAATDVSLLIPIWLYDNFFVCLCLDNSLLILRRICKKSKCDHYENFVHFHFNCCMKLSSWVSFIQGTDLNFTLK